MTLPLPTTTSSSPADTLRRDRRAGALLSPRLRGDRPARAVTTAFRSGGRLVAVPTVSPRLER